ncbi:MAG: hypothetical protein RLZZ366_1570, partial [Pseudomonadota bacterium]
IITTGSTRSLVFPATRIFGALAVYVSRDCPIKLTLEGEAPRMVEFAIIPPHTRHSAITEDGHITKVLIETETVDVAETMKFLSVGGARRNTIATHMRAGFVRLPQVLDDEVNVDALFFGSALPVRSLDPRIARVVAHINRNIGEKLSGQDCAVLAGLSFSRFIHLFRAETGSTFRGYQAWRHARNFMPFVNGSYNLVDVAMQLGYADAPHFSRSIRQYYGITPKQISAVSRKLRVVVQPPHIIQGRQRIADKTSPKVEEWEFFTGKP